MKCPKCELPIPDIAKVCDHCGAAIVENEPPVPLISEQRVRSIVIMSLVAGVCLVCGGFMYLVFVDAERSAQVIEHESETKQMAKAELAYMDDYDDRFPSIPNEAVAKELLSPYGGSWYTPSIGYRFNSALFAHHKDALQNPSEVWLVEAGFVHQTRPIAFVDGRAKLAAESEVAKIESVKPIFDPKIEAADDARDKKAN